MKVKQSCEKFLKIINQKEIWKQRWPKKWIYLHNRSSINAVFNYMGGEIIWYENEIN